MQKMTEEMRKKYGESFKRDIKHKLGQLGDFVRDAFEHEDAQELIETMTEKTIDTIDSSREMDNIVAALVAGDAASMVALRIAQDIIKGMQARQEEKQNNKEIMKKRILDADKMFEEHIKTNGLNE